MSPGESMPPDGHDDEKPAYVHAIYTPHRIGLPHLSVLFSPDGKITAEACGSLAEAGRHRFARMAAALPKDVGVD